MENRNSIEMKSSPTLGERAVGEALIQKLLDKFMDGLTTLEEEDLLADYFRDNEPKEEWRPYKEMFAYFDRGMTDEAVATAESPKRTADSLATKPKRISLWKPLTAAAAIAAAITLAVTQPFGSGSNKQIASAGIIKRKPEAGNPDSWKPGNPQARTSENPETQKPQNPDIREPGHPDIQTSEKPENRETGKPKAPSPASQQPKTEELLTEQDLDNQLKLQQARLDSKMAECQAALYIADYYSTQLIEGEEPSLPEVSAYYGDCDIEPNYIMTLIMQ